ncbi:MAG: hypothetical protein RR313_10845 [Anaerovoracaceae bacterium]
MVDQEKLAHWKVLFKEHEESGLSLTAFCAIHQVKRPTYHYWKNRIKEADKPNIKARKPITQDIAFVKVPNNTVTNCKEISLQLEWHDLKLSVATTEEAILAARLIKELQSIC